MSILKEFKEFAMRGSVVDMAVGVIVGAAFGKIVSSLVADVIMPPIGLVLSGVDFRDLAIVLKAATDQAPAVTLNYGKFIQSVADFVIIAFAIFLLVKAINTPKRKLKQEEAKKPEEPPRDIVLLEEIRDLLKEGR